MICEQNQQSERLLYTIISLCDSYLLIHIINVAKGRHLFIIIISTMVLWQGRSGYLTCHSPLLPTATARTSRFSLYPGINLIGETEGTDADAPRLRPELDTLLEACRKNK